MVGCMGSFAHQCNGSEHCIMHQPWWATVSFFFCQLGGNMVPYLNPVSLPPNHFLRDFNATFNSIQRRLSIQLKACLV